MEVSLASFFFFSFLSYFFDSSQYNFLPFDYTHNTCFVLFFLPQKDWAVVNPIQSAK